MEAETVFYSGLTKTSFKFRFIASKINNTFVNEQLFQYQ